MKISKKDLYHIAYLARISIKESEVEYYQESLGDIFDLMDELKEVETDSVELFFNSIREMNSIYYQRPDEIKPSLDQKSILSNAPNSQYGQFRLRAVVEAE